MPAGLLPTDQLVLWLAKRHGLDAERDIERVFLGGAPAAVAALQQGAIDAFVFGPPSSLSVVDSGEAVYLFNIVGKVDLDEINSMPLTVLAATEESLSENRDTILKYLRAYVKAVQYANAFPDAVPDLVRPLFPNIEDAVFTGSIASAQLGVPEDPLLTVDDSETVLSFMESARDITLDIDPSSVVVSDLVRQAAEELEDEGWVPTE